MKLHRNARTCPKSRKLLCERIEAGWSAMEAAAAAGISDRTARRWLRRNGDRRDHGYLLEPDPAQPADLRVEFFDGGGNDADVSADLEDQVVEIGRRHGAQRG